MSYIYTLFRLYYSSNGYLEGFNFIRGFVLCMTLIFSGIINCCLLPFNLGTEGVLFSLTVGGALTGVYFLWPGYTFKEELRKWSKSKVNVSMLIVILGAFSLFFLTLFGIYYSKVV